VSCAFCHNDLIKVLDFGKMALPGAFLKPVEIGTEPLYPLRLMFCPDCLTVQLEEQVPPQALFQDYFYFSSSIGALCEHARRYADQLMSRFAPQSVIEIGCNDGVMLRHLVDRVPVVVGVDPSRAAQAITDPRITVINDYFTAKAVGLKADLIVANNVMAHIEDINGATAGIRDCLADDGVFVFEVHHLGAMVASVQYDWVYHEHRYYYSLLALIGHLGRHGLSIFDVERVPMHGGSIRVFACPVGKRQVSERVSELLDEEIRQGLHEASTFKRFAIEAVWRRNALADLVGRLSVQGRSIAGYGASGRSNTILQWCGINSSQVEFIVDEAPAKVGHHTPGTHIPIVKPALLDDMQPDYVLILAWTYYNKIHTRCGNRPLIVPLPTVQIVQREGVTA
jgi:methylation protein EvaC